MKLKALSLLAGAIALTLTATPLAVKAQTQSSSPLVVAQAKEKGPWQSLGLTDAQKNQIQQIRRNTRTQIEGVLTQEQKDKLRAAYEARQAQRQAGQRPRMGKNFAELNLTEAQKTRIRQISESSKRQIEAVLTPEQQEKIRQFRENARQRRQQRDR